MENQQRKTCSGIVFSKVAGLQAYVNNPDSYSSELLQNMINLIVIFSYKYFLFRLMQIDILKHISPLKSVYELWKSLNCDVLLTPNKLTVNNSKKEISN